MNRIVSNPWRRDGGWTHRAMLLAGALVLGAVLALSAACGDDEANDGGGASASPTSAPAITIEEAWARKSTMGAGGMMTPGGGMMTPGSGGMMTPGSNGMMTPGSNGMMTPGGSMMSTATAGERGAAYMIIRNSGAEDDALIGASSDVAAVTEVHESKMDGETVTMQQVARIDVPAQDSVELKPGGYHVMFIGLTRELKAGDIVSVTLHFEKAGDVAVQATVRDA